jgi:hypothetical protein
MPNVYFYNSHTHAIAVANSSPDSLTYPQYLILNTELHTGIGLHGPFHSLEDADKFARSMGQTPQAPIPGAAAVGDTPQQAASNAAGLTGVNAIGSFFNKLGQGNMWRRAGEFVIGGILVYVGMRNMFPEQVGAITRPVKTAAKAAVFL